MIFWGFRFMFVSIVARSVSGSLTCLSCKDTPLPRDCQYTAKCGSHEVCYTNSYITTAGAVRHELGCMDTAQCSSGIVKRSAHNLLTCSQCCNGTLCNSGLCGQTGIPPPSSGSRGPICYSCDQQLYPDSCHIIKECSRDEVCMLQRFESQVGHDLLYSTNCVKPSVCAEKKQQYQSGIMFGKRNSRIRIRGKDVEIETVDIGVPSKSSTDTENCVLKCCSSDLCNADCSGASVVSVVHVPQTNPAPTTTQTPSTTSLATPAQTTATPAQTTDCRDSRNDCYLYYYSHCNTSWGIQHCRKTCGHCHATSAQTTASPAQTTDCRDSRNDCYLYYNSQCNTNWGLQHCRKTCGHCHAQPAQTTDCSDSYQDCYRYYQTQCNSTWGLQNCRKTCGLCNVAFNDPCIDHTVCYQHLHNCNEHRDWAMKNCIRSCNLCQGSRST